MKHFIFFLFVLNSFLCFGQEKNEKQQLAQAKAYQANLHLDSALQVYNNLLKQNPKLFQAYYQRAELWLDSGEYFKAIDDFLFAYKIDGTCSECLYYTGLSYFSVKNYDESIVYYDSAIVVAKDENPIYYLGLADALIEVGDFKEAREIYSLCLPYEDVLDLAYYGIGLSYYQEENYDSAKYNFSIALTHNPIDPDIYYYRALSKYALEDYPSALKDFNYSIELDSTNADAFSKRAAIYLDNGDIDLSINDLLDAYMLDTTQFLLLKDLGELYLQVQDYEEAYTAYSLLKDEYHYEDSITLYNLGFLQLVQGQPNDALANFKKALVLAPNDIDVHLGLANSYFAMDKFDQALEVINKGLQIDSLSPSLIFTKGQAYFYKELYDQALKYFNKTLLLDPEYPEVHLALGNVKMEIKKYLDAVKEYDLAIVDDPVNAEIFFKRGLAMYELNDLQGALEDFSYSITLDPNMPAPYTNRGLLKYDQKDKDGACEDWKEAFMLGSEIAQDLIKKHCN